MRRVRTSADERSARSRIGEAILVALGGGALGWSLGRLLHPAVGVAIGSVALLNGLIGGWRGTYAWRRRDGWIAFVFDSTWAAPPVALGLLAHLGAVVLRHAGPVPELGHRQNRHVYRGGVALKPGFAFTIGNVISGAGNVDSVRRRRLITDHEDVHIWQSRWFGPLYPLIYVVWAGCGAIVGVGVWTLRHRSEPLAKVVESCAYYANPFEWWAYSRDDLWPPPGKVHGIGWAKAAVRPLASLARRAPVDGDAGVAVDPHPTPSPADRIEPS
jgi:hypothetical protein